MKFEEKELKSEVQSTVFDCYSFLKDKKLDSDTDEFYKKIIRELLEFLEMHQEDFSEKRLERYMLAWLYSGYNALDNGMLGPKFIAITAYFNLLKSVNCSNSLPVQHFGLLMKLSDEDFNKLVDKKGAREQIDAIHFGYSLMTVLDVASKLRDIIFEI